MDFKTKITTLIKGLFPKLPIKDVDTFHDFVEKNREFNQEIRKNLKSAALSLDFSEKALLDAKWTPLEARIIRQAYINIYTTYLIKRKNVAPYAEDKIVIFGKSTEKGDILQASSIFETAGNIFRYVCREAADLLSKDPNFVKILNDTQNDAIKIRTKEGLRLRTTKEIKDTQITKIRMLVTGQNMGKEFDSLSPKEQENYIVGIYGRFLILGAEGQAKYNVLKVQAGHIAGHENFKLGAIGKLAVAAHIGEIPSNIVSQILVKLDISEEFYTEVKTYIDRKVTKAGEPINETLTQKCVMELASFNSEKGELALSNILIKKLSSIYSTWVKLGKTQTLYITGSSSPSFIQRVEDFLITILTGGKSRRRSDLYKIKSSRKYPTIKFDVKGDTKVQTQVLKKGRPNLFVEIYNKLKRAIDKQAALPQIDMFNIQGLINATLAANVEQEMGKSTDPPILLRYQTGRFAESAKLLTLTRSQAGVLAGTYTYMRYPYDTFKPPLGLLSTPKRDPRLYIEGAIRKAALTILKSKFPGIALELV